MLDSAHVTIISVFRNKERMFRACRRSCFSLLLCTVCTFVVTLMPMPFLTIGSFAALTFTVQRDYVCRCAHCPSANFLKGICRKHALLVQLLLRLLCSRKSDVSLHIR